MEYIIRYPAEILLLLFLAITFLQSGLDKIFDWNGNLSWLKGHFAESPLKNVVPLLVGILLLFEMVSGILCGIGIYQLAAIGEDTLALYAAILSSFSLLMLLFGQKSGKGL